MGLNCKIHRGQNNVIDVVEAPNGEESGLYRDALNHINDSEKALDIWSVAYTNGYREVNGDWTIGNKKSDYTLFNLNKNDSSYRSFFSRENDSESNSMDKQDEILFNKMVKYEKNETITRFINNSTTSSIDFDDFWSETGQNEVSPERAFKLEVLPYETFDKFINNSKYKTLFEEHKDGFSLKIIDTSKVGNDSVIGMTQVYKDRLVDIVARKGFGSHIFKITSAISPRGIAMDVFSNSYELEKIWDKHFLINKSFNLDRNGEPKLKSVLSYIKRVRTSGKRLSNKELAELSNNLYSLPINSLDELYKEVRSTFYSEGVFTINEASINNSILYSNMESTELLSSKATQKKVKELVEKIEEEYISDNSKFDTLTKTFFFNDQDLLLDSNEIVGIGKFKALNPIETNKVINEHVGAIKDRETFDKKVQGIPFKSIVDRYYSDSEFANQFFNRYSKLAKYPVLKEVEGQVSKRKQTETNIEMTEVVMLGNNTEEVLENIDFISTIPDGVWQDSSESVQAVLEQIEEQLIDFNVDVVGLSKSYDEKSQKEVVDYLEEVNDFLIDLQRKNLTSSVINDFANSTDTYFDRVIKDEVVYTSEPSVNRTYVKLNSSLDELALFENDSLIKVGENTYHKVKTIKDKVKLYDTVYELVTRDNSLLPSEAFYPSAYDSDNTFNRGKLNDIANKQAIQSDIRRFILQKMYNFNGEVTSENIEALEDLIIYKMIFQHPLNVSKQVDLNSEYTKFENRAGNFDYLTTDFIADFYNQVLINKFNDTKLYKDVLRHFKVNEKGITLKNDDAHTRQQINLLSPNTSLFTNLKNYSNISKDSGMNALFPQEIIEAPIKEIKFKRALYSNNPSLAPYLKNDYELQGDVLVTKNNQNLFVRTNAGLFEKVQEKDNVSFYRNIPIVEHPYFNNYGANIKVNDNIDLSKFTAFTTNSPQDRVSVNKLYTKSEEKVIKKRIDECG